MGACPVDAEHAAIDEAALREQAAGDSHKIEAAVYEVAVTEPALPEGRPIEMALTERAAFEANTFEGGILGHDVLEKQVGVIATVDDRMHVVSIPGQAAIIAFASRTMSVHVTTGTEHA